MRRYHFALATIACIALCAAPASTRVSNEKLANGRPSNADDVETVKGRGSYGVPCRVDLTQVVDVHSRKAPIDS